MKSSIYIIIAVVMTTLSISLFLKARSEELSRQLDVDVVPPIRAHQEPVSSGSNDDLVVEAQRFVDGIVPGAKITYDNDEVMIFGMAYNDTNTIRVSRLYKISSVEERIYILCHEASHLLTSAEHDAAFYNTLEPLILKYGVSWATARRLEQHYPAFWNHL